MPAMTYQLQYSYKLIQVGAGNVQVGNTIANTGTQTISDTSLSTADMNALAVAAGVDMSTWLQANYIPDATIDNTQD